MINNDYQKPPINENNLIDFIAVKNKKDTAEIVRYVAQQICHDCIAECHKINLNP
ncbi:MAG: hypothetical protein GX075_12390 [Firmicutes bacterium]|nr:hypothetical protein [Bacillota bacterium]